MTYALVINNNPIEREHIEATFVRDGVNVLTAPSEEEALGLLQGEMPGLIVWDWPPIALAPEIFVACLRQEGFAGPIVVCGDGVEAEKIPYDLRLPKPWDIAYLTQIVKSFLSDGMGTLTTGTTT